MEHTIKEMGKPAQTSPDDFLAALQLLKDRVIKDLPRKFAQVKSLVESLTASCFSPGTDQQGAWPPELEILHQCLHKLAGIVGSVGLHKESQQLRALLEHVALWENTMTPPDKHDWVKFAYLADSLVQSAIPHAVTSTGSETSCINVAPGRGIWVVEDDLEQAALLKAWLESQDYQVHIFADVDLFSLAYGKLEKPDVILMDMRFEDSRFAGAEQIARLRAQFGNLPPVVFISVQNDLPARLMAFRAGATRYLEKPLQLSQVIHVVDELSGAVPPLPFRILLVDDDITQLEISRLHLNQAGFDVCTLAEPLRLLEELERFQPDVLILDIYMPEASGPELAAVLREDPSYSYLPIIFLSAEADPSKRLLALGMGGDDYLIKPVNPVHLVASVRARAKRSRKLAATQIPDI